MIIVCIVNNLMKKFFIWCTLLLFEIRITAMKTYARDITLTLIVKAILLFLLWYVCVRGMHPTLSSSKEWMLGKEGQSISSGLTKNPKVEAERNF